MEIQVDEKIEHSLIKFLTLEGSTPTEIDQRLLIVYQDRAPSYYTVKKWVAEYKRGRRSLQDDPFRPAGNSWLLTTSSVYIYSYKYILLAANYVEKLKRNFF